MIALLLTLGAGCALMLVANEPTLGPMGFVLITTLIGFAFTFFVGDSLQRLIPASLWDRCWLTEKAYRRLGVGVFNYLLSWIVWKQVLDSLNADHPRSPQQVKAAVAGHGWALLLHILTAGWTAIGWQHWIASLILLLIGILGHMYPLLQQSYWLTLVREGKVACR